MRRSNAFDPGTYRGDWMQTYSGRQFWPLDPRPEHVNIVDIAHSLSMLCRYNGHSLRFYSVAEHCCHLFDVFDAVAHEGRVWALLHDASEAYLSDVPRPLKPFLPGYKDAEAATMIAIATAFGLTWPEPEVVKIMDGRILGDEMAQNMAPPPVPWKHTGNAIGITLRFWDPATARDQFLRRFDALVQAGQVTVPA